MSEPEIVNVDRWGFPVPQELQVLPPPRRQRGKGSFSDHKLLPGLRALCEEVRYGESVDRNRIAARCGVSKDTIRLIEREALRKLRARMGPAECKQALEFLRTRLSDDNLRHVSNSR